jgi:hypothetical protein
MKIYLAYRDGYRSNSRFITEFDADSILSWFQNNWEILAKDDSKAYKNLLGKANIYRFNIGLDINEKIPQKPSDLEDLKRKLENYFYIDTIEGNEDCVQVLTDDDEIQLAWFMFTDNYKKENWEKLSIWFTEDIPIHYGTIGKKIITKKQVTPKGNGIGETYFVSCPIFDSGNLSSLSAAFSIEGIRLPELVDFLNQNEIDYIPQIKEEYCWGFDELDFIQFLLKKSQSKSLKEVLELANKIPHTEIGYYYNSTKTKVNQLTIQEILNLTLRNKSDSTKSKLKISEHFCELGINIGHGMYNYSFIFDDLWVANNEALAKSIIRFGETWRI